MFAQGQAIGFQADASMRLVQPSPCGEPAAESPLPRPAMTPTMVRHFQSLAQARNQLECHLEALLSMRKGHATGAYERQVMLQEMI